MSHLKVDASFLCCSLMLPNYTQTIYICCRLIRQSLKSMTMFQLGNTLLGWVRYKYELRLPLISFLPLAMALLLCDLQTSMAFFKDQENVVSAAMTVTQNLMDKYQIDPRSIGRCFSQCYLLHVIQPQLHLYSSSMQEADSRHSKCPCNSLFLSQVVSGSF